MKSGKWIRMALAALLLLTAGSLAFAADKGLINSDQLAKIQTGVTTAQQVTEILGPPWRIQKFPRRGVEAWDYWILEAPKKVEISVEIDSKGVVSNIERVVRYGP